MKRLTFLPPLFLVFLLIPLTYAADIDITEFDDLLGEALGVGAFGGGLIITFFLLFFFLGIYSAICRRAPSVPVTFILGFAIQSMCIAFGWFPVWSLIMQVLLTAFLFGDKILGRFRGS